MRKYKPQIKGRVTAADVNAYRKPSLVKRSKQPMKPMKPPPAKEIPQRNELEDEEEQQC
jgi:hypothetical protein